MRGVAEGGIVKKSVCTIKPHPWLTHHYRKKKSKAKSRTKEKEKGHREKQHQQQGDEDEGDGKQAVEQPQLRRSARMSKGKVTDDLGSNGDDGEEGGEEDEGDMEVEAPHKARSVKEK